MRVYASHQHASARVIASTEDRPTLQHTHIHTHTRKHACVCESPTCSVCMRVTRIHTHAYVHTYASHALTCQRESNRVHRGQILDTTLAALLSGAMYAHVSSRAACESAPSPAPCGHLLRVPAGTKRSKSPQVTPPAREPSALPRLFAPCACAAKRREAPGSSRAEIPGAMLRKRDLVRDASPLPPTPASFCLTPPASTWAAPVSVSGFGFRV